MARMDKVTWVDIIEAKPQKVCLKGCLQAIHVPDILSLCYEAWKSEEHCNQASWLVTTLYTFRIIHLNNA